MCQFHFSPWQARNLNILAIIKDDLIILIGNRVFIGYAINIHWIRIIWGYYSRIKGHLAPHPPPPPPPSQETPQHSERYPHSHLSKRSTLSYAPIALLRFQALYPADTQVWLNVQSWTNGRIPGWPVLWVSYNEIHHVLLLGLNQLYHF